MGFGTTFGSTLGGESSPIESPAAPEAEPHIPTLSSVLGTQMHVRSPVHTDLGWQRLQTTPFKTADSLVSDVDERVFTDAAWQRLQTTTLKTADSLVSDVDERVFTDASWQRLQTTTLKTADSLISDEEASKPFIDGLDPCTIGSAYRNAALAAAKINTHNVLATLSPVPESTEAPTSDIVIPCGDRIPEWHTTLVDLSATPLAPAAITLDDARTIILVNDVLVYREGVAQNGWSVGKVANSINGYDYTLTGPGGLLPLGSVGVWVHLEGVRVYEASYDFTVAEGDPPYLENQDPAPDETGVSNTKLVELDILDAASGVDLTTVEITVGGSVAYQGSTDTFYAPFNGASSAWTEITEGPPYGYHFVIHNTSLWVSHASITVGVAAEDNTGNPLYDTYTFYIEDYVDPTILNTLPTGTGIAKDTPVTFEIREEVGGSEVNASSLDVQIAGVDAIIDGVFQTAAGFTGTLTPNIYDGYDVVINHNDFPSATSITVYVYVEDNDGNDATANWSFTTEDYVGPTLIIVTPGAGAINVEESSSISFKLADDTNVELVSVVIELDRGHGYELVYNLEAFQAGWGGPGSSVTVDASINGYLFVIDPEVDLPIDSRIALRVAATDSTGNSSTGMGWYFYTRENTDCFTGPLNTFEESLLVPYAYGATTLYYTEQLRSLMLNIVMSRPDPIKAMRHIFLRAHEMELAPILRSIVPTPSIRELDSRLCYKRTAIQIDGDLRRKPGLLLASLTELRSVGLPQQHSALLRTYLQTDQPGDVVPLACIIICMAKALEENELT